jgi:hypothetical protein
MRRLAIVAATALLLLAVVPAAAAKEPIPDPQVPLTGTILNTWEEGFVNEIGAGEPFYVENGVCGWAWERVDLLNPTSRVEITLDGKPLVMGTIVDMHFYVDFGPGTDPCYYGKFNYHNFRFGLPAGTYTFQVTFYWLDVPFGPPTTTTLIVS